jgi:Holliday junction resolvasome RuvABC endonuclease subunit
VRILALDIATKCGFAYNGEAGRISGTWDLSTRRDESTGMKLLRLESKLVEFSKMGVELIVFEAARHAAPKMQGALVHQAKLQAIVERFCERRKIHGRGYSPAEIKAYMCGKGNAKKADVIEAVRKRFGYAGDDDNEADAIGLLELARSTYDVPEQEIPF